MATVYVEKDGHQEEIMRDVAWIRLESSGLHLITLLGESQLFQARIKRIDLVQGLIILEMTTDSSQVALDDQEAG